MVSVQTAALDVNKSTNYYSVCVFDIWLNYARQNRFISLHSLAFCICIYYFQFSAIFLYEKQTDVPHYNATG